MKRMNDSACAAEQFHVEVWRIRSFFSPCLTQTDFHAKEDEELLFLPNPIGPWSSVLVPSFSVVLVYSLKMDFSVTF